MAHKFKQTSGTAQAVSGALLRTAKACALLGISKTTLYTWSKMDPTFPQPIRIGARCTAWKADELAAWIESRSRVELREGMA